MESLPK
ncbi:unnamed protein product, partial [Rotaria sp. Silwood1]